MACCLFKGFNLLGSPCQVTSVGLLMAIINSTCTQLEVLNTLEQNDLEGAK